MSGLIDPQRIEEMVRDCMCGDDEMDKTHKIMKDDVEWVEAKGITATFGFVKKRLDTYAEEISEMLDNLPETFHAKTGGGWSFLNACNDKNGDLWTGEHHSMEMLFVLGIAIGRVLIVLPREMWSALPGGMPYFAILSKEDAKNVPVHTGHPVEEKV